MPLPEVIEDYYATYYAGFDRGVTFSNAARFAAHVVRGLPRYAFSSSVRILDYGGGDGTLSRLVAERLIADGRTACADVTVVDFSQREAERSGTITVRFQLPDQPIEDSHDVVLASAILEHVPDLHPLLTRLHDAIAAGGFFYARTPWAVPLKEIVPRLDLVYPAHVHDLGRPFWDHFPERFGWRVRVLASRPSLVAAGVREGPLRALAAAAMKWPARLIRHWALVGGWEVLMQRR